MNPSPKTVHLLAGRNAGILLVMLSLIMVPVNSYSQNRAPSCWLNYQDNYKGDIIINTLRVMSPSPLYTYYCALQWNAGGEGGGYCGMQEHPNGRNFIYSIWDPISSTRAIAADYKGPGTLTENFGGEGTGLKSWNFALGWKTDEWYTFVSRNWNQNTSSFFGFWVFSHADTIWHHIVTMNFPVANVRFNTATGSFIEDWSGNGWNTREVQHKEGWKRRTANHSWNAFSSTYFSRVSPDEGAKNYIDHYDGGVTPDYYFMKSGGDVTPVTTTSGNYLRLTAHGSRPDFKSGKVIDLSLKVIEDNLSVYWTTDDSGLPQFSYHIEVRSDSVFTGTPLLEVDTVVPHSRTDDLNISGLTNNKEYFVRLSIKDIFDGVSDTLTTRFTKGTVSKVNILPDFQSPIVYPNPMRNRIYINLKQEWPTLRLEIQDMSGKIQLVKELRNISKFEIPTDAWARGIYILKLSGSGQTRTFKLVKP